ncbi:tetraspanin-18B-like isoform X2 [Lineus longissimus]|uniref:tetraspanin-18B-like isoform X2 n=1 Tax=Lineus longissimus TaxID=88925 RepID=UPI002B4C4B0E
MGLSCGMKCLKYILFTFNIILFLIGAALLAVGIFVAVDASKLFELLDKVSFTQEVGGLDVKSLLKQSAYVIIAFGAFVFLVAFLGCCGAIKESKCMLGTYATIVCICLIVEIAAVILAAVFWNHTKAELENYLNRTIIEDYNGYNTKLVPTGNTDSLAWDFIMIYFKCCGRNNYKDFDNALKWNKTLPDGKGTAKIPPACCVMKDNHKFPNMTIKDPKCPTNPTTTNAYMKDNQGCQKAVEEKISKYAAPIIGVCAAVAFIQLFVIIAACCVCRHIGRDDDFKG